MTDLQSLVESYMVSAGFNLLDVREGFVVADKLGFVGHRDTHVVWITPPSTEVADFSRLERNLLSEFESTARQYPGARLSLVAHTLEGFSREFRKETGPRVKMRVPVQFFDTPFNYEVAPGTRSAITALRDEKRAHERVPQPYSVLENGEPRGGGDDLLVDLWDELRRQEGPCLRAVVGVAGAGKSILFESLFSRAIDHFYDRKRKHQRFHRPMPLVPAYLRQTSALRTEELINSFIRTDVAAPVSPRTFEWMLVNDFSMWMFDGLDELYAGDPDFFERLLDLLTQPGSKAQVLLCARESLLTSCEAFSKFLEEYPPGPTDAVRVYRLEDWGHDSKRCFVWLGLVGKRPGKGERDPQQVSEFLSIVNGSPSLRSLSGLPYYCSLLLDEYKLGHLAEYDDDVALIEHAVQGMIEREKSKGLLYDDCFIPGGVAEWLETIALEIYEKDFAGVAQADLEEYAEVILADGLVDERRREAMTTLVQFPLLSPGAGVGMLTFKHELLAEYLAGQYLLKQIASKPASVARDLGERIDLVDSLIARSIASRLPSQPGAVDAIVKTLRTEPLAGRMFANLLQLLLLASPGRDVVKSKGIDVEGRDLRHVQFCDKDLSGVSFRGCDLSNTTFARCDMRDARLEGTVLSGTRFEEQSKERFGGARFGNLERFDSAYVGRQRIDERDKMADWVRRTTGSSEEVEDPCPASLQLRALFLKFVYPDGRGRRDELKEDALRRGKRFRDAPAPQKCIRQCVRFGFMEGPDHRGRIRRASGDRYRQIVEFVRDWRVTMDVRQLLGSLCSKGGCEHVPGALARS